MDTDQVVCRIFYLIVFRLRDQRRPVKLCKQRGSQSDEFAKIIKMKSPRSPFIAHLMFGI